MTNLIDLLHAYDSRNLGLPTTRRITEHLHRKFLAHEKKASKGFLKQCEFRPILSGAEFQNVATIVHNEIRRSPAGERELKSRWFSLSQATDRSVTFVCLFEKTKILGTVTIVLDSRMGLPSDCSYKANMSAFRSMGREMAEITSLVLNTELIEKETRITHADRLVVALKLMKTAVEYSMHTHDVDTVVIRCNRRHELIHKALFYRPLTGLEYYTGKEKQEYPAFFLDVDVLKQQSTSLASRLWNINFKVNATANAPKPFRFSFSQLMQTFNLVKTAL